MQDDSVSSVLAMGILQSCTKPLKLTKNCIALTDLFSFSPQLWRVGRVLTALTTRLVTTGHQTDTVPLVSGYCCIFEIYYTVRSFIRRPISINNNDLGHSISLPLVRVMGCLVHNFLPYRLYTVCKLVFQCYNGRQLYCFVIFTVSP